MYDALIKGLRKRQNDITDKMTGQSIDFSTFLGLQGRWQGVADALDDIRTIQDAIDQNQPQ